MTYIRIYGILSVGVIDMAKSKFTTTLDTELLKQAKIEAIQLDMSVAQFLEKLIKEYFEEKDKE